MNLAHRIWLGLLALPLAGCESPVSPDEVLALIAAERRWAARGFQDYRFEVRSACFCPPEIFEWARVDVVAGQIVGIHYVETGDTVPTYLRSSYHTIETLFHSLKTSDYESTKDVVMEFDPQLGYPTRVTWVPASGISDGGGAEYLRAAGPSPAP